MKVFSADLFGVAEGLTDAHGWSFWWLSALRVCGGKVGMGKGAYIGEDEEGGKGWGDVLCWGCAVDMFGRLGGWGRGTACMELYLQVCGMRIDF